MRTADNAKIDWVSRMLGVEFGRHGSATFEPLAYNEWRTARGDAIATLSLLESKVRAGDHPDRDKAIVMLRAIRANLTEKPETERQINELERYISTDDIVAAAETPNVLGVRVTLKEPLLKALRSIR